MLRKVTQDSTFKVSLSVILRFIALDSKTKARYFKKGLRQGLDNLIYMTLIPANKRNKRKLALKVIRLIRVIR